MAPKHVQLQIFIQADITNGKKKTARELYPAICSNAHDHVIYFKASKFIAKTKMELSQLDFSQKYFLT